MHPLFPVSIRFDLRAPNHSGKDYTVLPPFAVSVPCMPPRRCEMNTLKPQRNSDMKPKPMDALRLWQSVVLLQLWYFDVKTADEISHISTQKADRKNSIYYTTSQPDRQGGVRTGYRNGRSRGVGVGVGGGEGGEYLCVV